MAQLLDRLLEQAPHVTDWEDGETGEPISFAEDIYEVVNRVKQLEAQVRAADALADILTAAMHEHDTANYEYGEENPWTMQEWFSDEDRAALAAYRAAKEGGA